MCPCLRWSPGLYVQPFEPYANVLLVVTPVGVASTAQSSMDLSDLLLSPAIGTVAGLRRVYVQNCPMECGCCVVLRVSTRWLR